MIAFLARLTGLDPLLVKIGVGLAVAVAFTSAWCLELRHIENVQKARDDAATAAAVSAQRVLDAQAQAQATVQRQTDTLAATQLQSDLKASYAKAPDTPPSPVRLALFCQRVRGTPAARKPEFSELCGPEAGSQAAAKP